MGELILKAEGSGFEGKQYDLRSLERLLSNYRQIIDRTLPIGTGQKTLSAGLKARIDYQVELRPGCLEIIVDLICNLDEDVLGAVLFDGGSCLTTMVASLLSEAIAIRRKAAEFLEKGMQFNLAVTIGDNNCISQENNKGMIPVKNIKAPLVAETTRSPLNRIINTIDNDKLVSVEFKHDGVGVKLTGDDHRLTEPRVESLPDHIDIVGRLDVASFSARTGTVVSGNQRFSVTWGPELRNSIRNCVDTGGVVFKAKPVVDYRRIQDNTIGFHIVDCKKLQAELNL